MIGLSIMFLLFISWYQSQIHAQTTDNWYTKRDACKGDNWFYNSELEIKRNWYSAVIANFVKFKNKLYYIVYDTNANGRVINSLLFDFDCETFASKQLSESLLEGTEMYSTIDYISDKIIFVSIESKEKWFHQYYYDKETKIPKSISFSKIRNYWHLVDLTTPLIECSHVQIQDEEKGFLSCEPFFNTTLLVPMYFIKNSIDLNCFDKVDEHLAIVFSKLDGLEPHDQDIVLEEIYAKTDEVLVDRNIPFIKKAAYSYIAFAIKADYEMQLDR